MELRDIQIFLILAEELHFGRTARRLYVTQGRVSQTIRALEHEIGGKLFERTSRQVRLTALGRRFEEGARLGYDTLARTLRDCQAAAGNGRERLRLGYSATIGGGFAARVAAVFEECRPDCATTLNAVRVFRPDIALHNEEVDVMLAWSPGGDGEALASLQLTVGPVLAEVGRGVLMPDSHPLAARRVVSLEDLVGCEFLAPREAIVGQALSDRWVPRHTPSGRPLNRAGDDLTTMTGKSEVVADDVITLVARGYGLHFTVRSLLEHIPFPGLTVVPITDMPPMVIVPVWPPGGETATVRAFADAVTGFRLQGAAGPRSAGSRSCPSVMS
ncbi:LysR family transcriptional regulator [Nonomuraea sp. B12E4]|uniref:LysR family transcriptional regulator n=1 Tax=Nonomuraea sp. B12E4 TaxID=3153564 RepID=UPI00325DBD0F